MYIYIYTCIYIYKACQFISVYSTYIQNPIHDFPNKEHNDSPVYSGSICPKLGMVLIGKPNDQQVDSEIHYRYPLVN